MVTFAEDSSACISATRRSSLLPSSRKLSFSFLRASASCFAFTYAQAAHASAGILFTAHIDTVRHLTVRSLNYMPTQGGHL